MLPLMVVVMATPQDFLCMKKQTGQGTQLITAKQTAGRQACRESCTDQCQLAVFDSATQRCSLYTYHKSTMPTLTASNTATVMIKSGAIGKYCDASYNCFHGRSDNYQGRVNHTVSGLKCQRWDSQKPHQHNYQTANLFVDASMPDNFCRTTLGDSHAPWCYTTDPSTRWDYCDVKHCDNDCCHNDAEAEKMENFQISLDSLNSEVDDKEKDIDTLQSEKKQIKGQLTNLDKDVTSQAKKIKQLESSASSSGQKLKSLESLINSLQAKINALQSDKSSQDKQIKSLQSGKSSTDSQVNSLKSQISSLNSKVAAPKRMSRTNCRWTGYVNSWDDRLKWYAPGKAVIVGAESYHDNGKEDRRWKFYYCELTA